MKKKILYSSIFYIVCFCVFFVWAAEGGTIRSGETVSGELEASSTVDSWVFYGQTGDRVIIDSTKTSGTMTGTYLTLYPPDGGSAESAGLGGIGLDHQLQKTGLYTITVEAHTHFGTGEYDLTILKIPGPVSCPDDQDGGMIFTAQTISGAVNSPSDYDAFQFYGQAGDRVLIDSTKTSGTMTGTYLKLYSPDGGSAESAGLGGIGLDHQLQKTGLYTITVEAHTHFGTGGYDVSLTKIPYDLQTGIYNPAPQDKGSVAVCGESLVWEQVQGATGYDIFFGENVDKPLLKIGDNVSFPLMTLPGMEMNEIYYWHVIALTQTGDIESPYWWFKAGKTCNMLTINKTGNGNCTITSNPSGINCGTTCSLSYDAGTNIAFAVTPDETSIFAGWSGDADCTDGQVMLNDHRNCVATCNLKSVNPQGKPVISASPRSVNLGNVAAGSTSNPRNITIKNTGTSDLIISPVTITGANASEFNQTNDCTTVPKGSSCTATVIFNPKTPFGKKSATMSIVSNDPKKPNINVKLSGQAPPPKISSAPKSVNLGKVPVGSTSASRTVTVKNTGTSDLIISVINISGVNASEFSKTNNCTTLPKGSSCTAAVIFSPISVGNKSAVISISSNDPKKTVLNVKLTGKGIQSVNVLSNSNASMAGAAAIQSTHLISTTGLLLGNVEALNVTSKNLAKPPMTRILNEVLSIARTQGPKARISDSKMRSQGSDQASGSCSDGGTVSIKATWIGPDEPEDVSEIVNLNATITFNSCREDAITFKGTIKVNFEGSADNPSKITIFTSTFSYTDSDLDDHITLANLKIIITDFVLSDVELADGTITLNGTISGMYNAAPIEEEFDNFRMAFGSTAYGETLIMSGRIKPSCIGAWVTVTTSIPILIPGDDVCPTAGDIVITSNADNVRMVIASDYKITIYFNDTLVQTFNDCEEIDGLCVG